MRLLGTILITIFSVSMLLAQPPAGDGLPGDVYGQKPSSKGTQKITKVVKKLAKQDTVQATVTAKVLDVCSVKGCWIKLEIDQNQSAFVKMQDYAFFVPMAAVGKEVLLEGKAFKKITSVEELKHYAEDAGKSQAEIDAIREPKEEVRFLASGIEIIK